MIGNEGYLSDDEGDYTNQVDKTQGKVWRRLEKVGDCPERECTDGDFGCGDVPADDAGVYRALDGGKRGFGRVAAPPPGGIHPR